MTPADTARLLAKVQAYDHRTVGKADIAAWCEALPDVEYADALDAVAAHFRDSTDWLMPAHIRALAKKARASRSRWVAALPGPYETDEDRDERIARGIALCRAAAPEPPKAIAAEPATPSERIRQAALERARREPRARRTDPTRPGAVMGAVTRQIRSSR